MQRFFSFILHTATQGTVCSDSSQYLKDELNVTEVKLTLISILLIINPMETFC